MSRPPTASSGPRLSHDALLFADDDQFVEQAVTHLQSGLAAGEQVALVCPPARRRAVMSAFDRPDDVAMLGTDGYAAPLAMLQWYADLTRRVVADGSAGLAVVGEPWGPMTAHPRTWPQWARYEAVINHALAALPFRVLCAYDVRATDVSLLAAVRATHPHVVEPGASPTSGEGYLSPRVFLDRWSDPEVLAIESTTPMLEVADIADAEAARRARGRLGDLLARLDTALVSYAEHLPPADPSLIEANEYLVAVDEVLANALTHGGGSARLRVWVVHDQVVTTITDSGPGFDDPFLGYLPEAVSHNGAPPSRRLGLWLARQMCEELSVRRDDEGFTVRLRADLDVRAP